MPKVDPKGFRKDIKPFFNQFVLSIPAEEKQPSPFIVNDEETIKKCSTLEELLQQKDDAEVLQTWPGKRRSDVFYFTVKELRDHIKKGG